MENKPTHYVYHVTDRVQDGNEEKGGFWTKIGAAWPHSDRKGFTVSVEMLPLNGRLVLREPEVREEREARPEEETVALPE